MIRLLHVHDHSTDRPIRFGFLTTYPSTQCGIATFASSLAGSLRSRVPGTEIGVVRMVADDDAAVETSTDVVFELSSDGAGEPLAAASAAAHLNTFDIAVVQHEYGIFAGADGDQVLAVLAGVRVPIIVVMHTVLAAPTPHQRYVLERLALAADIVVTLSATGHARLCDIYDVDAHKVVMIPHGAWADGRPVRVPVAKSRPTVLTWGLLGPGKGLEWGVEALAGLRGLDPLPRYLIAGQTHPRVLARDGERYRESLIDRAAALGVEDMLSFEPGYLDAATLRNLVAAADVILLPYDSHEQVTSGVLIEAVASLTPVVSTSFPHARELLADGAGTLVPHADPAAISRALYRVLTEPAHAAAMVAAAAAMAPALAWPSVADRFFGVADALRRDAVAA